MPRIVATMTEDERRVGTAMPISVGRHAFRGQDEIEAVVAATAPAILDLLGDGVPRSGRAIIRALVHRHPKPDLNRTLMRLAVTGRLQCDAKQRFTLPTG